MKPEVEKILEINDAIAELATLKRSLDNQTVDIAERMRVIAARIELDIATAADADGKRRYSNEDMRRATRTLRLDEDKEYQALKQNHRLMDEKRSQIIIEHNRLVYQRQVLILALGIDPESLSRYFPDEVIPS